MGLKRNSGTGSDSYINNIKNVKEGNVKTSSSSIPDILNPHKLESNDEISSNKKPEEDFTMKRSYDLKPSTYLKLQELKVFKLPSLDLKNAKLTYKDIVDMAICDLYDKIDKLLETKRS